MHVGESRRRALVGAACGALLSALPMAWLWGFSVDDALITARVATHIANGFGYRFNTNGLISDAVTPLGFAYVLAPFAKSGPVAALYFAKWLGAACGVVSAALLGGAIAAMPGGLLRLGVLGPLGVSAPFAAWCVSGMETGVVVLLVTVALFTSRVAAPLLGVAAAWRPELLPFAVVLAVGRAIAARRSPSALMGALAYATVPAVLVAACRKMAFGHAAPLAVWAKPSDAMHGAYYLAVCLIWTGAPLLVMAPRTLATLDRDGRAALLAVAAHCLSLVVVGGDWMALCRLFVPVLPALFLVGARLSLRARAGWTIGRVTAAFLVSTLLLSKQGPAARRVLSQRLSLIEQARPALAGAARVATVDVGWVGAVSEVDIVDLAGVTDEVVAHFPGGHTSKRLPSRFIESHAVDAAVLLYSGPQSADYREQRWERTVEYRVASQVAELAFVPAARLELEGDPRKYLILRSKDHASSD